jgi:hypothetical protein
MKWIIVNGGDVFEGTPEQWKSVFFDNINVDLILEYCRQEKWNCQILNYVPER